MTRALGDEQRCEGPGAAPRSLEPITRSQVTASCSPIGAAQFAAFNPQAARDYANVCAHFVLVGTDDALVARASEALAASFIHDASHAMHAPYRQGVSE
ncbi:hypothetical protein ACFCWG_19620 [Streptomyces sp. NPDC056390]|uniref:hypothetical protein n=1 Tax=Streptomyces sp. NPDC056390 TaxID=3345806 RepID=UPI0035D72E12